MKEAAYPLKDMAGHGHSGTGLWRRGRVSKRRPLISNHWKQSLAEACESRTHQSQRS